MTTYSVLYAFGDSLSDDGNAYLSTTSSTASALGYSPEPVSPPYFQEIYSGVTADVFSNGPVWTQDLASALSLGTLAPSGVGATANVIDAALTPHVGAFEAGIEVALLEQQAHVSGTNPYIPLAAGVAGGTDFAIGGALTGLTGENTDPAVNLSDLSAEMTTFQNDVTSIPANALATVSMGGNDLINLLEDSNFATLYGSGTTISNVAATQAGTDIAQSVSNEAAFLGSLVALGVTNMVVLDVPDVGQIPEIMMNRSGETAAASVLSTYYNNLLTSDVATLNTGGANIQLEDEAAALSTFASGTLTNITTPVYSGPATSFVAGDLISSVPATQDTYLFFDTEHPTETGQTAFSDAALQALGVSCFAEGTGIRAPEGDRPVESLRPGDMVTLAGGGKAAVVWAGHRRVDCARHPSPANVWPVRVRADAFGPSVPSRDVWLSPDHAVFVDGVLIPVKHLIDGDTIAQVPVDRVRYFHIELASHDVLLAEGLPVESYLNTGDRGNFANGDGPVRLFADFRPRAGKQAVREARSAAPLIVAGTALARARGRVRRRVAAR